MKYRLLLANSLPGVPEDEQSWNPATISLEFSNSSCHQAKSINEKCAHFSFMLFKILMTKLLFMLYRIANEPASLFPWLHLQ
jgi:hypothetical protein